MSACHDLGSVMVYQKKVMQNLLFSSIEILNYPFLILERKNQELYEVLFFFITVYFLSFLPRPYYKKTWFHVLLNHIWALLQRISIRQSLHKLFDDKPYMCECTNNYPHIHTRYPTHLVLAPQVPDASFLVTP